MTGFHIAASLAVAYILHSLSEYSNHRFLMHRMRLAKLFGSKTMREMVINHMAKHHKRPYLHDTHEEDDKLWHMQVAGLIPIIPAQVFFWFFDPLTFAVVGVFGVVYSAFWWVVHREMHWQEGRFFSRTALYRYLDWRHQCHHDYPNTTYNVILPFGDLLFGTRPNASQRAEMKARSQQAASSPALKRAA